MPSSPGAMSDGFCAYEVVLSASALARDLAEYPLIIEFVDGVDSVIGYSFIAMDHLLSSSGSASKSKLRFIDKYYAIHSLRRNEEEPLLRGAKKRYGDLKAVEFGAVAAGSVRVCCSLERFNIAAERERVDPEAESTPNGDVDADVEAVIEDEPKMKMECDSKMESECKMESESRLKSVEKAVIEELRRWKAEQQRLWLQRVEVLEAERLNAMESSFRKNEEIRWQQLRRQKAEIVKLEKKLKCSLYDIEGQEKKVKAEQSRLEDRRRELEQIYKLKTAELVGALKRARNDNKAEQETLNRTIQFLQNENELISNKYRHEEKRCNEFRAELNRHKRQFDASSMGQLQIENDKLKHQLLCAQNELKVYDVL